MTTDPTPLQERIARAMYAHSTHEIPWDEAHPLVRGYFQRRAAAVLPIIAAEVRKAQADAWGEGWKERSRRDVYRSGLLDDTRPVPGPPRSLNPHRETED